MIIGYYGIPIKTIIPGEDHPEVESIQLVLRIFHFFYIPIFPVAKIWTVNKNGQRFKIQGSSAQECERLYGNHGYPFYAFAGIILIALVPVGISVHGMIQQAHQDQQRVEVLMKNKERIKDQIETLAVEDFLIFTNSESKYIVAKVIGENKGAVILSVAPPIENNNQQESVMTENVEDNFPELQSLFNQLENFQTTTIDKKKLEVEYLSAGHAPFLQKNKLMQYNDVALVRLIKNITD